MAYLRGHGGVSELQKLEVGFIKAGFGGNYPPTLTGCTSLQAARNPCAWCCEHPAAVPGHIEPWKEFFSEVARYITLGGGFLLKQDI